MANQNFWEGALRSTVRPLWYLGSNRISQAGIIVTTASAITLISLYVSSSFGVHLGPYVGIVAYLILPSVFALGLVLIPLGMWLKRRREQRIGLLPQEYPRVDLRERGVRETLWFVVAMTAVNVALFLTATYRGVHYMDSVQFCGQTCHTVMNPEYIVYQNSPHARVSCVKCHIGPGAPWFVKAKLSGVYQMLSVAFGLYSRPIPTPIEDLRPSRDTCEQCHWPLKFLGEKLVVKAQFEDDEDNTESKTALLMHTGGLDPLSRRPVGNHGVHLEPGAEIHYVPSDEQRQEIPYVRYKRPDGEVIEFVMDGEEESPAKWQDSERLRLMDCMDCHNRPTHTFNMPEPAVNRAIAAGLIDRSLPYVKQQGIEALNADYPSHVEAGSQIRSRLHEFYRTKYPGVSEERRAAIDAAADALVEIFTTNVFPEMKIDWGTYPNNVGHERFPGCFRCHDGSHVSADGRDIPMDCDICHQLLAFEEKDSEILRRIAEK